MTTGIILIYARGVDLVVEWKIDNFFNLPERDGAGYYSPDFSFGGERWYLSIYPNGSSGTDSSGHMDMNLWKYSSSLSIEQSFSLSLKTTKGEKYNEQHFSKNFGKTGGESYQELLRFIPRSELTRRRSELVPEGVLTVVCTMKSSTSAGSATTKKEEVGRDISDSAEYCTSNSAERSSDSDSSECCHKCPDCLDIVKKHKLLEELESQKERSEGEGIASGSSRNPQENKVLHDLKELFLKKEGCDVVLKVKGSEFLAHRLILRARSPVFASTFRHDMKENATGIVEIEDCNLSTFSDFLCFLYCGDIRIISLENVFDLFTAADKYQVLDLRAMCWDFMKMNLTVNTFCETISLALQHSETDLIKLCTDYFKKNAPKIIVTVKWQTFLAENPTESNELFIKLLVPNSS